MSTLQGQDLNILSFVKQAGQVMNPSARNQAIKVLLVEDNPGDARMLREILRDDVADPFELIWVESLAEAVAGLAEARIDLILLDLSLPDATGLATLTRMQHAAQDVPIIVLTGQSDATLGLVALRAGAQDYLLKQNLDSHLLSRVLHNAVDHKRASQVQQESEARFRALVQRSTDITTILAADGTVLYESPALEKVMGYKPEAVQGLNIIDIIHPDDLPSLFNGMMSILDQPDASFSAEVRLRHADGTWRIQEMTITNLLHNVAIQGIVVNSRDVTERRRTEAEVVKQANLLDQVADSIIALDPQGRIEFWNRGSETLYGWSAAEVIGKPLAEVIATQVVNDTLENALHALMETGAWNGEYLQTRKDGTKVPVLNATTLLRDAAGQPVGFVGINRDMTERKRADNALVQSEQRFHNLFEYAPLSLWLMDYSGTKHALDQLRAQGVRDFEAYFEEQPQALEDCVAALKILEMNQSSLALYRAPTLEAFNQQFQRSPAGRMLEVARHFLSAIANGQTFYHTESVDWALDGTPIDIDVTWTVVPGFEETLGKIIRSVVDISERKRAERALRQYNQRLEILHSIDRSILSAEPPQQIAARVAQALTELIPCDAVRIITLDAEDNIEPYLADFPPASPASQALLRQAVETYGVPDSFRQGQALRIDDVQTAPDLWTGFEAVLTAQGARAWIIVPLIAAEQMIGVLALGSLHPRAFSADHVEIAREVTDQLAIALHKSHLDAQIEANTLLLEARVIERTEQFRAAKERSEAILMSASEATIVAQPEGSIEQVNTAFSALFGYSLEQGRTLSLFALLDAASTEHVEGILDQLVVGDPAKRMELVGVRQDGTPFDADAAFTRVADRQTTLLICSLRDITLRKAQERQLRYAASLQETVTDAVIATDLNFSIQSWNPAAEQIYGWQAEEVLGRPVGDILLTEFSSQASGERVQQDFLEKGFWTDEVVQRHKDGRALNILSSTVLFKDETGQPFGLVAVNHDISVRIKAENELRQAWAKEKELNELKTRFVSMVAHDFRTPLASIQSSGDLLQNYSERMTDEKKQQHFTTINRQIKHLTGLLDDTLTLTKAESVGMEFNPVLTRLEGFFAEIMDEMQPLAGTRQIRFSMKGSGKPVSLDRDLLRRALVNLLSNAVKYSPEGSVVEFSVLSGAEQLELSIQDQGIGIPEEAQAHLFEVFHRARNVGDIPGTGLGLSIVKRVVEAHGGTMTVESVVDVGSTFTMILPVLGREAAAK